MSAASPVTIIQFRENTLDLGTNITAWNPCEKFINNQPYSQLPRELDHAFYLFNADELSQLKHITHVSIPIAYWKDKRHKGGEPDVFGRIAIPIQKAPEGYYCGAYKTYEDASIDCTHHPILKDIGYTLQQVCEDALKIEKTASSVFAFLSKIFDKSNAQTPFNAQLISGEGIDWSTGAIHLFTAAYGTGNRHGGYVKPLDYINVLRDSWRQETTGSFDRDTTFILG